MKIIFYSDSHISHDELSYIQFMEMMEHVYKQNPDVICNLGDYDEILMNESFMSLKEGYPENCVYVLGNHDLYSKHKLTPPNAFNIVTEKIQDVSPKAIPLQKSWEDDSFIYEKHNCLFLGTIGFPDFAYPKLIYPIKYYDKGFPTIDGTYMNLKEGWRKYTTPLMNAFQKKLELISNYQSNTVVIISHYSGFLGQYNLNPNDDISPYFYCHRLGDMILECAKKNPLKRFYCVSGHGHEFMIGKWVLESDNVMVHGIKTTYMKQDYISLDIPVIS